ncbi:MAG: heavy-metal-associated domain-containing protein [Fermentimonas caenicola]|jgi:copper chaperone CopZ|nr:cation transporter [Fermentimonas sp.]
MKKVILATFALCTLLFIACNSESSGKNNTAPNNEMEHMETDAQHNETDHMTSGEVHEEHAMLNVKGSCEMCKDRIEKAAKEVEGVSFASWDTEKQVLHLNYDSDKATEDDISKALAAAGHDTDKYKAEQAVYDALPACCKYRE